jgi:hypothetical protein
LKAFHRSIQQNGEWYDMQDRALLWIVIILLVVSLGLNGYVLRQQAVLKNRVEHLPGQLTQKLTSLQGSVNSVRSMLNQLVEEEQWYSRPRLEVLGANQSCTEVRVRLTWSFRELSEEAEVGLSYRTGAGKEWSEADVTAESDTTYAAEVELPLGDVSWTWELQSKGDSKSEASTRMEEAQSPRPELEYVVYTVEDGKKRSGGTERMNIGKLAGQFRVSIHELQQNRRFSVTVQKQLGPDCLEPTAVELIGFAGDTSLGSTTLQRKSEEGREHWAGTFETETEDELTVFELRMMLENGETVTKEFQLR